MKETNGEGGGNYLPNTKSTNITSDRRLMRRDQLRQKCPVAPVWYMSHTKYNPCIATPSSFHPACVIPMNSDFRGNLLDNGWLDAGSHPATPLSRSASDCFSHAAVRRHTRTNLLTGKKKKNTHTQQQPNVSHPRQQSEPCFLPKTPFYDRINVWGTNGSKLELGGYRSRTCKKGQ